MAVDPNEVVERYNRYDADKSTLKTHLQEIADYMAPSVQNVNNPGLTMGGKRMTKIYDGTAIRALRVFANGLYGNLTPLSTPWFALTTKNKAVAESPNVMF